MCVYAQECYVFICMLCMPRKSIVIVHVQFFSVKYVPVIIDEEEQWRLVHKPMKLSALQVRLRQ